MAKRFATAVCALVLALLALSDAAVIEAALPADRPAGRGAKDFFDNGILQELEQEGFAKKLTK